MSQLWIIALAICTGISLSLLVISSDTVRAEQNHYLGLENFEDRKDYVLNEMSCNTLLKSTTTWEVDSEPTVKYGPDGEIWEINYPEVQHWWIHIPFNQEHGFVYFEGLDEKVEACK